jgi:hypothetical protein
MSTKTTQLGGTASEVTVGKVGVSGLPLPSFPIPILTSPPSFPAWFDDDDVRTSLRRVLSRHQRLLPSWRNPPISDEEAFASLKAGMDALPPGTKMFLNSGAYTNPYYFYKLTPYI